MRWTGSNGNAQKQGIFLRISVVARAAAFGAEAASLVEGDGRGVAGADFEGEVAGVVGGRPDEDCADEGGSEAVTASVGADGHRVEGAEILLAGRTLNQQEGGGGEGSDIFLAWLLRAGVDSDESGAEEGWVGFRIGAGDVGGVGGGWPARGFGGLLGDGEDLVEVGELHGAEGEGHRAADAGDFGFEKISASERRR